MSAPEKDIKGKLAAARLAAEQRAEVRLAAAEERELDALNLEAKYELELGQRGVMFDIVATVEGAIVLKLGEGILHTRFTNSKTTDVDVHDFVFPCVVHPEKEKYVELVARRPGVAWDCAAKLQALFHAKDQVNQGKR